MLLLSNLEKNQEQMSKRLVWRCFAAVCVFFAQSTCIQAQLKGGEFIVNFEHVANNRPITFRDSLYTNAFGEEYQVTKLKYYISNMRLVSNGSDVPQSNVFLVDAGVEDSLSMPVAQGTYSKIVFTLGIDSALNNSGAQDGMLDPLKGMFWTWNSGYIYFKLEGFSAASTADLQRIEHHIGGYTGLNKASREIEIEMPSPLVIAAGDKKTISLRLNLDKYWKGRNDVTIASNALIMVPGALAVKSADNFEGLFSISYIK